MKLTNLKDLLIEQLQDLYSAEHQLVAALPDMADKAASDQLRQAFMDHLEETKNHVNRLQTISQKLNETLDGHTCKAMEGLLKEGTEMMKMDAEPAVKDAGMIACAQRVEHYEIAGYGTAAVFAGQLGLGEVQQLLRQTLDEEKKTDEKLTTIAESSVNLQAQHTDHM